MSRAAQRSLRAIAASITARPGPSSRVASHSWQHAARRAPCCSRHRLYSNQTSAIAVDLSSDESLDPYPNKSDEELLACLQPMIETLEINDFYSFKSFESFPVDCASAYICLRLRPGFADVFPSVPVGTLVDLLISCSNRGLSKVASHLLDDIVRYRHSDAATLREVLAIPARKLEAKIPNAQTIALYQALSAAPGNSAPSLPFDAAKRVVRAYIGSEEEEAASVVFQLMQSLLETPQPAASPLTIAWIACEAVSYLASEEAFAEAVPLLQAMIAKKLLPTAAVQEMQLVDRSHPKASGIVVLSAVIRSCLEWRWIGRAAQILERLRSDCLEAEETPVSHTTMELIEEVLRSLLISNNDNANLAGQTIISMTQASVYPAFSQALVDLFYRRALDPSLVASVFKSLNACKTLQPSPPPVAIDSLCRYFSDIDVSKRSVALLMPHIRRADIAALVPYRPSLLIHFARLGLRKHAADMYELWADDGRSSEMLANSNVMLALVKAFTGVEKAKSRPYDIPLAQRVIQNYVSSIPGVSLANVAHTAALRLARAFFLVGSNASALKLFENILLDRAQGVSSSDVGALIVSVAKTRPHAALDLLKRTNRWGVRIDSGTYAACAKAAVRAQDLDLARSIEAIASEHDVEIESPVLDEARLLEGIRLGKAADFTAIAQDLRRAHRNPYHQVSDAAFSLMIKKAAGAGEWRAGIEAWRSRLAPRSQEKLAPRAEIIAMVEPLLSALEKAAGGSKGGEMADYLYAVRDTLAKQHPSQTQKELVARCQESLRGLGMRVR